MMIQAARRESVDPSCMTGVAGGWKPSCQGCGSAAQPAAGSRQGRQRQAAQRSKPACGIPRPWPEPPHTLVNSPYPCSALFDDATVRPVPGFASSGAAVQDNLSSRLRRHASAARPSTRRRRPSARPAAAAIGRTLHQALRQRQLGHRRPQSQARADQLVASGLRLRRVCRMPAGPAYMLPERCSRQPGAEPQMSNLAVTDELFFDRTGLDPRPRRAICRRGAGRAWTTASCFSNTASRRASRFDDGRHQERLVRHDPGLRPARRGRRGGRLCPCLRAVRGGDAPRRRPPCARSPAGMAARWPSRPPAPTAALHRAEPARHGRSRRPRRSSWPRSTPMPAAATRASARSWPRSPAVWQAVQILRADGRRAADIRPLVRLNVASWSARATAWKPASHGAGGRVGYEHLSRPGNWQGAGRRGAAPGAGQSRLGAGAGRRDDRRARARAGPGSCCTRRSATGSKAISTASRPRAFSGMIGQRVAAKGVTVVDDGTLPDRRGSLTIDDEGTPSQLQRR